MLKGRSCEQILNRQQLLVTNRVHFMNDDWL